MSKRLFVQVALVLASFSTAVALSGGDDRAAQSEMKQQFNSMSERVGPITDEQKALKAFVGKFDLHTEVNLGPDRVMKVHGIAEGKSILDGRFVEVEGSGAPDEELKGERINVFGWDTAAKKFTLWGVESMSNFAYTALGDFDEASKTFTFVGDRKQPDGSSIPFRWTMRVVEGGAIEQDIAMKFPGAQDFAPFVKVHHARIAK